MKKITIIKYLDCNGKIIDIRKDIFKSSDLPKNIIEEYEVEIKDYVEVISIEDLELKYSSGNYIKIWKCNYKLKNPTGNDKYWDICDTISYYEEYDYKLIHNKHKDVLEAYLKNNSVEIECTNAISKDADIETIWYSEENFIENYDENMYYRLKVKIPVWYEEKDNFKIAVKQIKSLNDYTGKDGKIYIMEKITDDKGISSYYTDGYHTPVQWLECYRPATEPEVLNLVYKPQQKVPKEINLTESDRLKDLFLNDNAVCLVENEQEFRLVYDFLDKNCDESLSRNLYITLREYPTLILNDTTWNSIFEWTGVEDRDFSKPLIKFDGEVFWEVSE